MALQLMRNSILSRMTRQLCRNSNNKTKFMSTEAPKPENKVNNVHSIGTFMHTVSDFDRRILVWVKRYPSMAEVPKQVTRDCIVHARSKARIRACNIMIVFTLLSFIIAIYSGKKEVAAGNSLHKMRMEWYEGLKREHATENAMLAENAEKK